MILRKINAILSLLATVLLIGHIIAFLAYVQFKIVFAISFETSAQILVITMLTHAALSIYMAIMANINVEKKKCNGYPALNKNTFIQRFSGIVIAILTGIHVIGAGNHFQTVFVHALIQPLFFILVLIHSAISTSKAFITLGIGTSKTIKFIDIFMKVFVVLTFILSIVGYFSYYVMGV